MSRRLIARMVGLLLMVEAGFMATSIFWAVWDNNTDSVHNFAIASALSAGLGAILVAFGKRSADRIRARDAVVTVGIGWLAVCIVGAVPFLLEGAFSHPADAFFESVSGFTTTGASALVDVESQTRALLWWRSLTQWLGGMGIIVLFIAIFPHLGVGAGQLFRSEAPGPIKERLRPKLRQTSLRLWYIYLGLTVSCAVSLWAAGMSHFDAMCHALATLATGGFSTMNGSIGAFSSVMIETVIFVFMFLAGVNFVLYYRAVQGHPGAIWRDPEFRTYVTILALATVLIAVTILPDRSGIVEALRHAGFQVVSLATTTGFGTDDYDAYAPFARLLLVGLMFVGGSAGSTAGGIKIARLMVIGRVLMNQLVKTFQPGAVLAVKIGKTPIESDTVRTVGVFFAAFVGLFFAGSLALTLMGLDILTASSAVLASLANIGPGLNLVGPTNNYAFVPPGGKVILSLLMITGRLEIFTVLALLVPSFWRK